MSIPLLVITADIPFGELIRQNLEEAGRFSVSVARDKQSALMYSRQTPQSLVFMDTSLDEKDILEIGRALRKLNSKVDFVIVSETGGYTALEELSPVDYLSKPFYLPDLLEMMDKLFRTRPAASPATPSSDTSRKYPWLSDVTRAAQHLTRLTLESSAQAALITRDDDLWAYAGQLPQSATRELADTVARYWDHQEQNDLVRFVRLVSTEAEHMLYATHLASGMVLALVFDAETPFSTIRSQANKLVRSLSDASVEQEPKREDIGDMMDFTSIADILSDIPSPNPGPDLSTVEKDLFREPNLAIPLAMPSAPQFSRESSPVVRMSVSNGQTDQKQEAPLTTLEQTIPSAASTRKSKTRRVESLPEDLGETRPSSITEVARKIVLEPTSPSMYNLDYACLLIPRFTHHHLTGDLSERLGEWVPQVCVAFGWRLEYISVRPEYLQWIVNVPPATSPGYLMRILRQQTSDKIFADFPRFKKENPSGDFWAPGYLIMGGSQPPPAQLIKDFVAQTRQRQGISQQINR